DIVRCFKPAVFGEDVGRNEQARKTISKFPKQAREKTLSQQLLHCGQDADDSEVSDIDFFVMFLRRVWWYILRVVAEDHHELKIPIHATDLSKYEDWKAP